MFFFSFFFFFFFFFFFCVYLFDYLNCSDVDEPSDLGRVKQFYDITRFCLDCDFDPTRDGISSGGSGGLIALNLCCYAEFAALFSFHCLVC